MKLSGKNILLISPEPWNHIFVSKHHYAVHLGKNGNKVFFLNPPSKREELSPTPYENVWEVNYTGFVRGLRFLPLFLQRKLIKEKFIFLQNLCNEEFNVVWSFDNSVFYDFSALPEEVLKISHIVDLNQDFQTAKAASTADVCFCTTDLIKERLAKFNKYVYKINHGLNLSKITISVVLPGHNKVKAMYVGNLAMQYLDWHSLNQLVMDNPEVDFLFIGSGRNELSNDINKAHIFKSNIIQCHNAYFMGKVHSGHIHSYLSKADVLLVAYQEAYHHDQANPHKMMEYLSSGKMIIATYTEEYKELAEQELFLMSKRNQDFPILFKSAIENLATWNEADLQKARQHFAFANTYDKQIDKISAFITDEKTN